MIKRYLKKDSLSYYLLLGLEKAIDGVVRYHDFYLHSSIYAQGYERPLNKSTLAKAIKRLRERGLIEENHTDTIGIALKITELGQDVLGISTFDESKWDGKWRVVIFDIPEQKRIIRDMFRRKLKHWGFKHWQQSVWVTKSDVTSKLRNTIKELGITKWVAVLESDNISTEDNVFNGR